MINYVITWIKNLLPVSKKDLRIQRLLEDLQEAQHDNELLIKSVDHKHNIYRACFDDLQDTQNLTANLKRLLETAENKLGEQEVLLSTLDKLLTDYRENKGVTKRSEDRKQ